MYHRSYSARTVDIIPLCKNCRYCSIMYHRSYSARTADIIPLCKTVDIVPQCRKKNVDINPP